MYIRGQFSVILGLLIVAANAAFAAPEGDVLPGAQLPPGETAVAMAWPDVHTLCLIVQSGEGYALRDLDVRTGEFSVVSVPPSFKRIRLAAQPRFVFAADGSGLAVLNAPLRPLQPGELAIFRRTGGKLEGVEQRGIPANFWVADAAWGAPGELFLAARHYLNPEQPYSVGRLDVATGKFDGVVLKGNIDLVDELTPLPQRGLLVMRCWGFRGEYPAEPVLAAWSLTTAQSELLHSQARYLILNALDGRQALAVEQREGVIQGDERWILQPGQDSLRRVERGMAAKSRETRLSPDGRWLVVLIDGRELSNDLNAGEMYVAMQATASGRTLATAVPCEQFSFAPDGSSISALAKGGQKVYYYSLPATEDVKVPAAQVATQSTGEVPARTEDSRSSPY